MASEEQRAMTAMAFFTGIDGFVCWNWSGTGNHDRPCVRHLEKNDSPKPGEPTDHWVFNDVMFGEDFQIKAEGGQEEKFKRYDVAYILDVSSANIARFQKVRLDTPSIRGVDPRYPVFTLPEEELLRHLRPLSEPVGAMVEGMALIKPLEVILRSGEVKVDVPARKQFAEVLPIVRRVKYGKVHVIVTYDPAVIYGKTPRDITLNDFDGIRDLELHLPADEETRIFVLHEM